MAAFLSRAYILLHPLAYWSAIGALLFILYDVGINSVVGENIWVHRLCALALLSGGAVGILRYMVPELRPPLRKTVLAIDAIYLGYILLALWQYFQPWGAGTASVPVEARLGVGAAAVFFRELSVRQEFGWLRLLNPAQLFLSSFLSIILLGTGLLMLPNAAYEPLSLLDALFTSTSAVCVTGLIVVDTGSYFTPFGQFVIMALIQVGGIGIMTVTSYFSYFFKGRASYEDQLLLKDMTNADKISDVFNSLKQVLLLTFLIELAGAAIIFFSLDSRSFATIVDQLFFAVFHGISAFCNAGFSTLENSLYEPFVRFNYPLQLTVACLFIFGGLGFPIVSNSLRYLSYKVRHNLLRLETNYTPWVLNINSRIVLVTTIVLLLAGTILFYIFEFDNTLAEHQGAGKWAVAFFGAATPRTAGFNSVDTAALHLNTVMIVFLLMWIGASPGSTGGGIKTTTIAVGTLNLISLAKGKDRVEVYRREISILSIRRSSAIIALSLIVIGAAVFLIASFDPDKELLAIAFECFSAYSTVGLSLGVTGAMSDPSKAVLIGLMFAGRVGTLTILTALLRRQQQHKYRYPTEDILIN
ncbi:MAG: ATPase [Bacteroidetes bacterium]|jgi:potassium uptake TrkH family protein|nr:ATPase [Bacteroidota bacterium]